VIGAREFLVAFNVNLNTTSTRRANAVAFDVRETGRPKREGDPLTGKVVTDATGSPVMIPGTLKAVKAIGWYIDEYGLAQVSMNLTDLTVTPLHTAFDEVCRAAAARGMRVTGSELVGLIPLAALRDAGRHYLRQQQRSTGVSVAELLRIAIKSLGLDDLGPFDPAERIIEYRLRDPARHRLAGLSLQAFADLTASESVAPGGGSVSAAMGALGASLGTMVANLSAHKRGWDARWEEFSSWAEQGQALKDRLMELVDEDTRAFGAVMSALALPKGTPAEKTARAGALETANLGALEVPWQVMRAAATGWPLLEAMAASGNAASASDAGVGALALRAAIRGAWLNVRTNATGIRQRDAITGILEEGAKLDADAARREGEILKLVEARMGG
jgi:glutamate formiminotransferase/formiminotetrahydrofolate cyclodeaminase